MIRINRFKLLEIPQDSTDYEDFEDIPPYNKLKNGEWNSLWMNRHPNAIEIEARFSPWYNGKLLWRELDIMKKKIEKRQKALKKYKDSIENLLSELSKIIREQNALCIKNETCIQKLQKHLDVCTGFNGTGRYKCTKDFNGCKDIENGRCGHYDNIESASDEIALMEGYVLEENTKIDSLEYDYKKALAIKEDRLQEFYNDYYSDDY